MGGADLAAHIKLFMVRLPRPRAIVSAGIFVVILKRNRERK